MKIRFSIEYYTQWGEDLRVHLYKVEKGGAKKPMQECRLDTYDGKLWESEITFQHAGIEGIEYKYAMYRNDLLVWTEWEVAPHRVTFDHITNHYILSDKWRPIPEDQPLFSSAYTECVGAVPTDTLPIDTLYSSTLQLRVVEPRLRKGEWLALCGSTPQLGEWQRPKKMALINLQEWAVNIDAELLYDEAEYKYVVVDTHNHILRWEEGPNRRMRSPRLMPKQMWVKTDEQVALSGDSWKVAGVVIPVFSLRSERSYGVGDFGDLKALIQWVKKTKMHAIQILPINDTMMTGKWQDSYPYNSISIYAFHPLYCDLSALPPLRDRLVMERFLMNQQRLNALKEIDYERVIALKMDYLRKVFAQEGLAVLESADFKNFYTNNKDWLIDYAVFSYLRDLYGTAEFQKWPHYAKYNKKEVEKLADNGSEHYDKVALYLSYMSDAYLIHRADRYNVRGKEQLAGLCKYYANDLCFSNYLFRGNQHGIGYDLENAVYLQLRRMGYDVYVGDNGGLEVDFVARRRDRIVYLQVAYMLVDDKTISREYASLESISDNYEKYVVSLDDYPLASRGGIINLPAWQLEDKLG